MYLEFQTILKASLSTETLLERIFLIHPFLQVFLMVPAYLTALTWTLRVNGQTRKLLLLPLSFSVPFCPVPFGHTQWFLRLRGLKEVSGIEPRWALCKASALSTVCFPLATLCHVLPLCASNPVALALIPASTTISALAA